MASFSFFPSPEKAIARLLAQRRLRPSIALETAFIDRILQLFTPLIRTYLSKEEQTNESLLNVIDIELIGLIRSLSATDEYFDDQYEAVLQALINACRWKLRIRHEPYAELAQNSPEQQEDIRQWIMHIRDEQSPNHNRRLALMLTDQDQQAVAYRTLRALLCRSYKEEPFIDTEPMFWLRNGRVELRPVLFRHYLFDQIALRVYLFHTTSEASFLEESLIKTKHWVRDAVRKGAGVVSPELEHGINEIVSEVKMDIVGKWTRKEFSPATFWLDCLLTTYLMGFVKQSRAIGKLLRSQQRNELDNDLSDEAGEPVTDEDTDERTLRETSEWDDETADQQSILDRCLKRLCEACRTLISRRYNNDFSTLVPFETLAADFGEPAKTLESRLDRCLEKLKQEVRKMRNK